MLLLSYRENSIFVLFLILAITATAAFTFAVAVLGLTLAGIIVAVIVTVSAVLLHFAGRREQKAQDNAGQNTDQDLHKDFPAGGDHCIIHPFKIRAYFVFDLFHFIFLLFIKIFP
ncbi:MAG: phage holin family protein [Lachnospiraceae bacterium]|nr:phage holin family protein [Lachnospiraceae bacterium]